jgi:dTDP-4-dehydrorhamnose 3,5-epimerase-like enzyme
MRLNTCVASIHLLIDAMNAILDLKGVRILDIDLRPDERGFFAEVLREDFRNYRDNDWITCSR